MSSKYKKGKKGVDLATIRKRNAKKNRELTKSKPIVPRYTYSIGPFQKEIRKPISTKFILITSASLDQQNDINTFGQNLGFKLSEFSSCDGYSFTTLYDFYRITKINIKVEVFPLPYSTINSSLTVTTGGNTGTDWNENASYIKPAEWIYWNDVSHDSDTYTLNAGGWDDLLNRDDKKYKRGHMLSFTYEPRPLQKAEQEFPSTIDDVPFSENPWIATNQVDIPFFGANIYSHNGDNFFNSTVVQTYVKTVTAYVEFFEPKL